MKVLITGGVGFIGTNAAHHFASIGYQVTIVDDFSRQGVELNAAFIKRSYPNIEIVHSDVCQIENYLEHLKTCQVVLHLAGQTAVTTSLQNPEHDFQVNARGTFLLLDALRKFNQKAIIIYSSTNKVYGDLSHHQIELDEKQKMYFNTTCPDGVDESEQLRFLSPYGCSKGAADQYVLDYNHSFGLKTVVFRQSCIYGEHQIGVEDQGWLAFFSTQFLRHPPITIYGDGFQVRDLLYVGDLIVAYQLAIDKIDQISGEVFNIGGGSTNAFSLLNIIDRLAQIYGYSVPINYSKPRVADQKYFVSNNNKINEKISWSTQTTVADGLKRLVDWQQQNLV